MVSWNNIYTWNISFKLGRYFFIVDIVGKLQNLRGTYLSSKSSINAWNILRMSFWRRAHLVLQIVSRLLKGSECNDCWYLWGWGMGGNRKLWPHSIIAKIAKSSTNFSIVGNVRLKAQTRNGSKRIHGTCIYA